MKFKIIYEIYNYLGNTDKRKLRQTCSRYRNIKLKEYSISFYKDYPFLIEYCLDHYYDLISQNYIHMDYLEIYVVTGALEIIKKSGLRNKAIIEISGGIDYDNIYDYASSRPDVISIGSLTHSVKSIDYSMEISDR